MIRAWQDKVTGTVLALISAFQVASNSQGLLTNWRGRWLESCPFGHESMIALFEVKSRKLLWQKKVGEYVTGLAFAPDDRHVVVGCSGNGNLWTFDLAGKDRGKFGGKLYVSISGNGEFSKDGLFLAFPASYGVMISNWGTREKKELLDTRSLSVVTYSPCGTRLFSGAWSGIVTEFN